MIRTINKITQRAHFFPRTYPAITWWYVLFSSKMIPNSVMINLFKPQNKPWSKILPKKINRLESNEIFYTLAKHLKFDWIVNYLKKSNAFAILWNSDRLLNFAKLYFSLLLLPKFMVLTGSFNNIYVEFEEAEDKF